MSWCNRKSWKLKIVFLKALTGIAENQQQVVADFLQFQSALSKRQFSTFSITPRHDKTNCLLDQNCARGSVFLYGWLKSWFITERGNIFQRQKVVCSNTQQVNIFDWELTTLIHSLLRNVVESEFSCSFFQIVAATSWMFGCIQCQNRKNF